MSPAVCEKGGQGGVFLPLFVDAELDWPSSLRTVLYFLGLLWCFMGVAIVSDSFMSAIETITSQVRRVTTSDGKTHDLPIWNDTIANLTLMALGSSAPEILLSLVEIFTNRMFSGELGPATIVGSASFNLFCITAICIVCLPAGEVRRIKDTTVYAVTSSFALFAYLWMYFILVVSSPNLVKPWEGIATFLLFPVFLITAFAADKGLIGRKSKSEDSPMTKHEIAKMTVELRELHAGKLSEDKIFRFLKLKLESSKRKSRAHYRVGIIRLLTASKPVQGVSPPLRPSQVKAFKAKRPRGLHMIGGCIIDCVCPRTTVEFGQGVFAVLECSKTVELPVLRTGPSKSTVLVEYATRDGTAFSSRDYIAQRGVLKFDPGDTQKSIIIEVIDDDNFEEEEDFFVTLSNPQNDAGDENSKGAVELGECQEARVIIIDDDDPGQLRFDTDEITIYESTENTTLSILVHREHGSTGRISCDYRTEKCNNAEGPNTRIPATSGKLEFSNQQVTATIPITIEAQGLMESEPDIIDEVLVILENPTGGATLEGATPGAETQSAEQQCVCRIRILPRHYEEQAIGKYAEIVQIDLDKAKFWASSWTEQFVSAVFVNGSKEAQKTASAADWAMHILTIPWKLVFSLIPPTTNCHGWLSFYVSLGFIAIITAFIGDLASFLGCMIDLPNHITAVTLVALGTSLPDTFASMVAAQTDEHADASIGNITGSNSVNVFLGIGFPWSIAAIYWSYHGRTAEWVDNCCAKDPSVLLEYEKGFVVVAGDLGFNVAAFCIGALFATLIVVYRRHACGGELGGPARSRYISAGCLIFMWVAYISVASTSSYL
eukprot:GEMP01002168.1.p1 GENE.GEMP01002168.1~~GEMP01002168.1.p1  ORF type:complete len:831 (+),score=138.04 GEMP01002168.1:66-2558(+)